MKQLIRVLFAISSLSLLVFPLNAQQTANFSGKVIDPSGSPLPFASISINSAQYGTVSDRQGMFQLKLPKGTYDVRVSYLGHRAVTDRIGLEEDLDKTYTLALEQLTLEDVIITSDGRDPAYAIIRKAIDNKDQNEIPFPEYSFAAYTKSAFKFREGFDPDSLMQGTVVKISGTGGDEEAPAELKSELLYLSENISEVYVKGPKQIKEKILSSQVSGDTDQFSILGAAFNRFNPYKNRTVLRGISERGLISPLSNNAFFTYQYKLLGTVQDEDGKAYKIQVTPKRKFDPAYSGTVYIADSSYAIKELDWLITSQQQLQILDTVWIQQSFQRIEDAWLPIQNQTAFAVDFSLLGLNIPVQGVSQSLLSDYNTQPDFPKNLFGREVISIADSALGQDSSYWKEIRPIPLTGEEVRDYQYKDSLETVQNSPAYLDSLTEEDRRIRVRDILFGGWSFTNYRKKTSWYVESLLQTLGFNPMEGFYVAPSITHTWDWEEKGSLSIGGRIRYGFSSEEFNGRIRINWESNPRKDESWTLEGGRYPEEYSDISQISPAINTLYSLIGHESFIRYYRKTYAGLSYQREVFNGLDLELGFQHEQRDVMENTSEYSVFNRDRIYEENLESPRFAVGAEAWIGKIELRFQPFNRYISTPEGKFDIGSAWPEIKLAYQQAFDLGTDAVEFSKVQFSLFKETNLQVLGTTSWELSGGRFLTESRTELPDLFHFKGNETVVRNSQFAQFGLMPYYDFSSSRDYLEFHTEHSFGGFLLSKLPLIRRLKLNEYAGIHVLWQENLQPYAEANFGLEARIFKILPIRVDANLLLTSGSNANRWGWKLVLP